MTIQEATYFILNKLRPIYAEGEASQITDWVMENLTGSKKAERMIYKTSAITKKEEILLQEYAERLAKHEPVQYVLNEAWFCGLKFYVDKHVLIPRPETEELVEWVMREVGREKEVDSDESIVDSTESIVDSRESGAGSRGQKISILDIGTGSGCIAIALKRKLKNVEVWSCDMSEAALKVAKRNAEIINVDVNFLLLDFLSEEERNQLPSFDIIVSNPPYVPQKDKSSMQPNVLNYEPHTALFVPDNDALIFYKEITQFGKDHLKPGGIIYAEIHESIGEEVTALFRSFGYNTELKNDMQGKDRMMKAW
ncbi:MAG: peptide chain release factor N(5)-glutamine methyltransferase [Chitinophagales bacterium]